MMFIIMGIPFVGGDICGYMGEQSSPELCTRWHQVGAFQPFSRNHRDCDGRPQEPFRFVNNTIFNNTMTLTDLMRRAILDKYSLIKYYYTHLFLMSQDEGSTSGAFYKPVFFEFPQYAGAFRANPSENVMLGPSLKLSIKTTPNKNWEGETHDFFFPQGKWCDILNPEQECVNSLGDEMVFRPASLKDYQLHLRDGHIIPFQNARTLNVSRVEDLKKYPIDLHINPKNMTMTTRTRIYQASGLYVNDDGNTTNQKGTFNKYQISFSYNDVVNGRNDDETIVLRVSVKDQASEFYSNETRCSNVNENDILGGIYVHDEYNMFQRREYAVMVLRTDGQYDFIGSAIFDPRTNIMVYNGKDRADIVAPVCLSNIEEIVFTGVPA
jgi:alpha-glucosidase (family GH31 glycosyl hydrolase)